MNNITIFGQVDGDLHRTVRFLQERNVNVVIRDEHDLNTIRIHEAKAKEKDKAISKETKKAIPYGKGKENAHPMAHNENVLSKATLAQRARREREKNQKPCSAYQLGQRLRRERERERSKECINPRQPSLTPNWPPPTTPCRNVGVVIRDEHDLNVIRVRAAKDKEKVNPMSKGKEKMAPSGKRMTNACQVVYILF
ncbi:hypothetical protein HYC85_030853 [Camellia sinensis]|uniref:Uncharacterized protein n=1 Tax=Camellia sinensis TaxID=4442 RepID=A0A7J7G1Y4_CAMSI|nr:hypothetical protein HYC85_030853 [Camellia sinensis]